jgi:hypothetical protein
VQEVDDSERGQQDALWGGEGGFGTEDVVAVARAHSRTDQWYSRRAPLILLDNCSHKPTWTATMALTKFGAYLAILQVKHTDMHTPRIMMITWSGGPT